MKANATILGLLAVMTAVEATPAQSPDLRVSPVLQPGLPIDIVVSGQPLQTYAVLFDVGAGPTQLFDETFFLTLGPALGVLDSGTIGLGGFRAVSQPLASAPLNVPLYLQAVLLDASRPAGFVTTDGETTFVSSARTFIIEDFVDPVAQGVTGDFDASVRGRLQAPRARLRTVNVAPTTGVEFGAGVNAPLRPDGVRMQMVVRATDLRADGVPERVTALRWAPATNQAVVRETYRGMAIDLAHTRVVPDYTPDVWTTLPRFPDSGLSFLFARNVTAGFAAERVFAGDYTVDPAARRSDGYVPFPMIAPFAYDGINSLLIDFRVPPDALAQGANRFKVYMMSMSSSRPDSRVLAAGGMPSGPPTVDPFTVTEALQGDNLYYDVQVDLVRTRFFAESRWLASPDPNPRYGPAMLSLSRPPSSSIVLFYRGSRNADGSNPTAWSPDVDFLDGLPFIQYRVVFNSPFDGSRPPSIDQIVVPIL